MMRTIEEWLDGLSMPACIAVVVLIVAPLIWGIVLYLLRVAERLNDLIHGML